MATEDPGDASMRASDADREAVAERLRVALGEGRLDLAEYDDRLRAAYAAITMGDLARLTADLPAPVPAKPSAEMVRKERRRKRLAKEWRDWAGTALLLVGIWLVVMLSGGTGFFWPVIPLGIWALIIIMGMLFGDEPGANEDADKG